ncbi:MAG: amidinotransferase [Bergeyella sp.]|nr:amidinotransferase [Bergeyella sp.]
MQNADTVLMIEPVAFGFNDQTAENNFFQKNVKLQNIQSQALAEFRNFAELLSKNGIEVVVIKDTLKPHTPDSIFPNNWVSFGHEGDVVLYPMYAQNRREERRMDIIEHLKSLGFFVKNIQDYTFYENKEKYLEGTGSIIFDHEYKIAYASVSKRMDPEAFLYFCNKTQYKPIIFRSYQSVGDRRLPVYHTNVMMCVASQYVVICLEAIEDIKEKKLVMDAILSTQKEIIEITEKQMQNFAGNMLQLKNKKGKKFLVMSQAAYAALTEDQIKKLERYNTILSPDLSTIETLGGGSARCMLAEIFLPKK